MKRRSPRRRSPLAAPDQLRHDTSYTAPDRRWQLLRRLNLWPTGSTLVNWFRRVLSGDRHAGRVSSSSAPTHRSSRFRHRFSAAASGKAKPVGSGSRPLSGFEPLEPRRLLAHDDGLFDTAWQLGIDDGSRNEFEHESNPDEHYYFAGIYTSRADGNADLSPAENEPFNTFDRALTNGDPNNFIHFNLSPYQLDDNFRLIVDVAGSSVPGAGIPFEVTFNGTQILSDTLTTPTTTFTSPVFNGADVGAVTGDNVIEIRRTDTGNGGYILFDYLALDSGAVYATPESGTVTIPSADLLDNDTDPDTGSTLVEFTDFSDVSQWNFRGNASGVNNVLQITPAANGQTGSAWYQEKIRLADGFVANFTFDFVAYGGNAGADGMGFVVQNHSATYDTNMNGPADRALTIKLDSYQNGTEPSVSFIDVRAGNTLLARYDLLTQLGVDVSGSGHHDVRVEYLPGDLDVYFDGTQVIRDVIVGLESIGAVDSAGDAWVGFGANTGGANEEHNVLDLSVTQYPDTPAIADAYFAGFAGRGGDLTLEGNATIVDNRLQLTDGTQSVKGTAYLPTKQTVVDGFSTEFVFEMAPPIVGTGADGMYFAVHNHASGTGAVFAETGPTGDTLTIELDSYSNGNPPDPSAAHISVRDGNGNGDILTTVDLNAAPFNISDLTNSGVHKVRVDYVPGALDVYFDDVKVVDGLDVDLTTLGAIDLSGQAYVGFGGRTGGSAEAQKIYRWSFAAQQTTTLPSGAIVTAHGDGNFTYDPNGQFEHLAVGQTATDTFAYTIVDTEGLSDSADVTVMITGENDAPLAVNDGPLVTNEDSPITIAAADLLGNDTDPDAGATLLDFPDFSDVSQWNFRGNASGVNNRLQITPAANNQTGSAWHREKIHLADGFVADFTFDFVAYGANAGADGMGFVVQNLSGSLDTSMNGPANRALTIKLDSYQNGTEPSVSFIDVRAGSTLLARYDLLTELGVDVSGSGSHEVRVEYLPGDLDVFFDGTQVIRDLIVGLESIGAVDSVGEAWVGFAANTGGANEEHNVLNLSVAGHADTPTIADANFAGFAGRGGDLTIEGNTTIVGNRLQLTDGTQSVKGTAHLPAKQTVVDGFSTEFVFEMAPPLVGVGADGMYFAVHNHASGTGAVFAETGPAGNTLTIEFDSYNNGNPPDPSAAHISVRSGDGNGNILTTVDLNAAPFNIGDLTGSGLHKVRVDYVPGALDVYFDDVKVVDAFNVDLTALNAVDTNGQAYVGFGGRTGGAAETQKIYRWRFAAQRTTTLPSGAIVTAHSDGRFTYDPNGRFEHLAPGQSAPDSFPYTITDGSGATSTATVAVTIEGVNDTPHITGLNISSVPENDLATLTVAFDDADASDSHLAQIDWGDGQTEIINIIPGARDFTADHQYLQDGAYDIDVSVFDDSLARGMVGLWNFDNDTAIDLSGNGNDGTVGSALLFATDVPGALGAGKSVQGDGTTGANGLVSVPTSPTLESIVHELTVAFWLKADTADNADWVRIARKGSEGNGSNSWLVNRYGSSNETNIRIDTTGTGGQFNQNRAQNVGLGVLDDTWHHVTYTLNRGVWEEYVDGIRTGTGAYNHGNGLYNTQPLLIVGRGSPNSVGQMDDVAVWNRALTSAEIGRVAGAAVPAGAEHHDDESVRVVVTDVAPQISSLNVSPIEENETAQLQIDFTDPGTLDVHQITIDWGDGHQELLEPTPGQRSLTVPHQYLDDDADDSYDITVTVGYTTGEQVVGAWSFDDGTAADASGYDNNGTVGSGMSFDANVPSPIGGGQSLVGSGASGSGGQVIVPSSTSLESIDDQLTIAFWLQADGDDNATWFRLMRKGTEANGTTSWLITRNNANDDLLIRTDTTGTGGGFNQNRHTNAGLGVLDGQWHHIAYVLDSGSTKEYVDGVLTSSTTYSHGDGLSNTRPLEIAGQGSGNLVGRMDELAIWSRALDAAEINQVAVHSISSILAEDTRATTVTVTNVPPTVPDRSSTIGENGAVTFDLAAGVTDQGTLDPLTFQGVTQPARGSVSLVGTTATFDPGTDFDDLPAGQPTVETFTYTFADDDSGVSTGTVTVTVNGANDAPTAGDDSAATDQDSTVVIDLLANDADPDLSDRLTVAAIDSTATAGSVTITAATTDTVVIADTFDIGAAPSAGNDGDDAYDTAWTAWSAGTFAVASDSANLAAGNALQVTNPGTFDGVRTTFGDISLGVGETLSASFDFRLDGTIDNIVAGFRFGFYDDGSGSTGDTGYFAQRGTGTSTGGDFIKDLDSGGSFLGGGGNVNLGGSGTFSLGNTGAHQAELRLTRTASDSLTLELLLDGATLGTQVDTGQILTRFGAFGLANGGSNNDFVVDNVQIRHTPATVTYDPNGQFDYLGRGEFAPDSFTYTVVDQNDVLFYYDFEAPDTTTDNLASDRSGNGRHGNLERFGAGNFSYVTDTPVALDSSQSLLLEENGGPDAGPVARLTTSIPATDFDFNASSWTYTTWFKRDANSSNLDFIFHLGNGDGFSPASELYAYVDGADSLIVHNYSVSGGQDVNITTNGATQGVWHHLAVAHDASAGTMNIYLDGTWKAGDNSFVLDLPQTGNTIVNGGHDSSTFRTERWFYGNFDDLAVITRALPASEVAELAAGRTVMSTASVTVSVEGVNDGPVADDLTDATDEDTSKLLTVAFSDADNTDSPEIVSVQSTGAGGSPIVDGWSDLGARVTIDTASTPLGTNQFQGLILYDPTQSAALQALTESDTVTDAFTYTIEDDYGVTSSATVSVVVTGRGGVEINMDWANTDRVRLVRNPAVNPATGLVDRLDVYVGPAANEVLLQTTVLIDVTSGPEIEVLGLLSGGDTLVVDNSHGVINLAHVAGGATSAVAIDYDGRGGSNMLEITGNAGSIAGEQYDVAARTIAFDPDGAAGTGDEERVTFASVASIADDKYVTGTFEILGTTAADTFDIGVGTTGTSVQLAGGSTPIEFANKTHTRISSLAGDDQFLFASGASLTGSIDGGPGTDTLDYSAFTSAEPVTVDLTATGGTLPAEYQGTATAISVGLLAGAGSDVGSSVENVLGGAGHDNLRGDDDRNLLGDGPGNDLLAGGAGDDTYLLEPVGGSHDYLIDTGPAPQAALGQQGDRVDFSQTVISGTQGITIDMDKTGVYDIAEDPADSIDEVALIRVNAAGVLEVDASVPTADVQLVDNPQTVIGTSTVTLLKVDDSQLPPAPSPFENVTGSSGDDRIDIDPLPTIRYVDGGPGNDVPLEFNAGGSEVIHTTTSVTALGIGSVVYDHIEVDPFNASARMIDNDDPGYSQAGNWGYTRVEGYAGDVRFASAGLGDRTARWTFGGVTPGWYRVAATWGAGANRAEDARFQVYDGTTAAGASTEGDENALATNRIAPINQEVAPAGFFDEGAPWQELADSAGQELFFYVTGHTLVVELSDDANDFVIADAVRIERVDALRAEIRVLEDATDREVTSGRWLTDLGTTQTDPSDPPTYFAAQTFTVQNIGLAPMTVTIDRTALPSVYKIDPSTMTIPAGGQETLTVTLASGTPGTYAGTFSLLPVNDRDENPFEIGVTGRVRSAVPQASGDGIIADNNDVATDQTSFEATGDFRYIRRDTRFLDDDYLYAPGSGSASATATWTVSGLTPGGAYQIAATWVGGDNRATNAPFVITAGGVPQTVRVNQGSAPNDFEDGGVLWDELTVVRVAGTSLTVQLTSEADGYVLADAIRVASTEVGEIAVYEEGGGELTDEVSAVDFGYSELMPTADRQSTRTFRVVNEGGGNLLLTEPISVPLGFSLVHSFQNDSGDPQLELAPGESVTFEVLVNAAAPGGVRGEIAIDSDDLSEDPFEFTVAAQVGLQIVDNADPTGFRRSGTGNDFVVYEDPRAYRGSDLYHAGGGSGDNWVDFTAVGLTPGTYYQVSTTWVTGPARASNATYEIYPLASESISPLDVPTTVSVDQRVAPDDFSDDGEPWEELTVVQATSSVMTVRLTDRGDNWIYADAVRFEQVYLPELAVTIAGAHYDSGQSLDLGLVLELPGNPAPVTAASQLVTVRNLGALPLELDVPALSAGSNINLDVSNVPAWANDEPITLGPGDAATFTVSVDNMARFYSGTVLLTSSDVTMPQFELPVSGRVVDRWVVDESDGNGRITGDFPRVTRDTRYYNQDYRYSAAGDGSDTLTWGTITGLVVGEVYEVSTTYAASSTRATNAPYTITGGTLTEVLHGAAVSGNTAFVNQQTAPDGFTDGRAWEYLGLVEMTGTVLTIQLSDLADGYVVADAVRVDVPDNLHLGVAERTDSPAASITAQAAEPALAEAMAMWESTGLTTAAAARLSNVQLLVTNLPGSKLGLASSHGTHIWIDSNAAGYGWTVDALPTDDSAINRQSAIGNWQSVDLLTVLSHELGHLLGREHDDQGLMAATVVPGGSPATLSRGAPQASRLWLRPDESSSSAPTRWEFGMWNAEVGIGRADEGRVSSSSAPTHQWPASAYDTLFARLDDRAAELTDSPWDDADDERDESAESQEYALDLWSVLYGLE